MTNQWLNSQIAVLQRYANGLPDTLDEVSLALDKPDVGWIDMHVKINGGEKLVINTSDVYDPFVPLRQWLEYLTRGWCETAASVMIDCEGYKVIFSYQPLFCPEISEAKKDIYPRNCGIFSIYNTLTEQTAVTAYCDTLKFIESFYRSLVNYAEENAHDPAFAEEWDFGNEIMQSADDDQIRTDMFIAKIKSSTIEDFITRFSRIIQQNARLAYRKQIKRKLDEHGFVETDLTDAEMNELIEEIKAEEAGDTILDGVLFNKDCYTGHRRHRITEKNDNKNRMAKK